MEKLIIIVFILGMGCQKTSEFEEICFNNNLNKDLKHTLNQIQNSIGTNDCELGSEILEKTKKLNLGNRNIRNLSILSSFKNLTSLDLKNNLIKDIGPLQNLKNLTDLNLENNNLSDISPLKKLPHLKEVSIAQNPINSDEESCPTDFKVSSLNNICHTFIGLGKLKSRLGSYDTSCSHDKPVNLLIKKKWGNAAFSLKTIKKTLGTWNGLMRQMPLYDQGQTGLCYAYAAIQLVDYWRETKGLKVTKKIGLSSPVYAALLLKSLQKVKRDTALDYGFPVKTIEHIKEHGMCREDIVQMGLKNVTIKKSINEITFYQNLKHIFPFKNKMTKEKLKLIPKESEEKKYIDLVLTSKNIIQATEKIFKECRKTSSLYLGSKNIPSPSSLTLISKAQKKLAKDLLRVLLNRKDQPIGVTYCSRFLSHDKEYKGIVLKENKFGFNNVEQCGLHASVLVGKKRKCDDDIVQKAINQFSKNNTTFNKIDFDEVIIETFNILSKSEDILPEGLGNQVLEKLKRLSFVWDKKIKWKEIKEILKTETYRDPASLDSEGHKILKKVCKGKILCDNEIIKKALNQYKKEQIPLSQKEFIKNLKTAFTLIFPGIDNEEIEKILSSSFDWVKNIDWEKLKESMIPYLEEGGLGDYKKNIYKECEKEKNGSCYYLLRNSWGRGDNDKMCSAKQWTCRKDSKGRAIGTWIEEKALLNNLYKLFYLTDSESLKVNTESL